MVPSQVLQVETAYILFHWEITMFQDFVVNQYVNIWGRVRTKDLSIMIVRVNGVLAIGR